MVSAFIFDIPGDPVYFYVIVGSYRSESQSNLYSVQTS